MGKLHQCLAVESDVKGKATAIYQETRHGFTHKKDQFLGFEKNYNPLREDMGDKLPGEHKLMTTTVAEKLSWTEKAMSELINLIAQKETANQTANADIIVDGKVMAEKVPALVLLALESKLQQMVELYRDIPTLEPGRRWQRDPNQRNVYAADPKVTFRTAKEVEHKVVAPATDKHPAQVANWTRDVNVGQWETLDFSGMMSAVEKADLLERSEKVLAAVKRARCKANDTEIKNIEIAAPLFAFIRGL